jgi:hypothetical protein
MDQMHEELMEPASVSSEAPNEDDDLESVSEAESNPNEDAKSYMSEEQGEEQVETDLTSLFFLSKLPLWLFTRFHIVSKAILLRIRLRASLTTILVRS